MLVAGTLGQRSAAHPSGIKSEADFIVPVAYGGNDTRGPVEIATAVNAHGGPHGRLDFESETFIAHSLRGEGFDASEDGTGRGTPLVPVAYRTSPNNGAWETGERIDALTTGTDQSAHLIAFSSKDHGADASELAPTLRAMGHSGPHPNAGGQLAANTAMGVRRLTPRECERLQGFPDDYTLIPWRGAKAPDGPRYKALGNSMAVPCMAWIGRRIEAVASILNEQ